MNVVVILVKKRMSANNFLYDKILFTHMHKSLHQHLSFTCILISVFTNIHRIVIGQIIFANELFHHHSSHQVAPTFLLSRSLMLVKIFLLVHNLPQRFRMKRHVLVFILLYLYFKSYSMVLITVIFIDGT